MIGQAIGRYQILAKLGEGGMGEVYRARDARLNRDVALKVLPESFAGDAERLARFKREAQTLAALNHPHIAQIHGLEESAETLALVMELVDGEDLSQRLKRGPIPLDEALPIARQMGVVSYSNGFRGAFDATRTGIIAYRTGGFVRQLAWFDRTGRVLGLVGGQDPSSQVAATVSPDGTKIVVDRSVAGNRDLWLLDANRNALTRLTSDPSEQGAPVWAPDGMRIAFESRRESASSIST